MSIARPNAVIYRPERYGIDFDNCHSLHHLIRAYDADGYNASNADAEHEESETDAQVFEACSGKYFHVFILFHFFVIVIYVIRIHIVDIAKSKHYNLFAIVRWNITGAVEEPIFMPFSSDFQLSISACR